MLPPARTEHLRGELKWLGEVLGAARDGEVLAGHLAGLLEQVPPELVLGPVAATVTEILAPRQAPPAGPPCGRWTRRATWPCSTTWTP